MRIYTSDGLMFVVRERARILLDRPSKLFLLSIVYSVWRSHVLKVYFVKGMERNRVDSFTMLQLGDQKKPNQTKKPKKTLKN